MLELPITAFLALATFGLVIGFAFWSKRRTEAKLDDPTAKRSSLAKDGPGPNPHA